MTLVVACVVFTLGSTTAFPLQRHFEQGSTRKDDTLATVDGVPITGDEFMNRFEMSLYPGKDDPSTLEKTKREFLYSMIAEKLLSKAAGRSEHPYTGSEDVLKKDLEDIFMRDALFIKEIVPRAVVTAGEVRHGLSVSTYTYLVDAFYFDTDSTKALEFYSAVSQKDGRDIYKFAAMMNVGHDTLEIPYGQSSAAIEDAFFGRKRGYLSGPVATVDGLVIFSVLGRKLNSEFTSGSTSDRLHRIREVLVNRKQTELANQYVESVMKGIRVSVNYGIFRPLVYSIQKIFEKQKLASYSPDYRLSPTDLVELAQGFSTDLDKPLLIFKGGSLSLGEIFKQLPNAMFATDDTTLSAITFALHGSLRFISQNHFLVDRARELGLQMSWEVRHNVGMFLDAFRSYRMARVITDSVTVTQKEVDRFFAVHHDEVLNSVRLKLKVFEAEDINEAVLLYTKLADAKRTPVDPADTTADWVNAYNLGELGAVLSQLRIGEIYGPVGENGKYYIYQLFDKRSTVNEAAITNSIEVAKQMLLAREKSEALSQYVAGLAAKERVRIYGKRLLALKATPFQMLTYRLVGFGGRILAVPALFPREKWIEYFQQKRTPPRP